MHARVVDMFSVLFLIVSFSAFQANSETIESAIYKYYKSDGVQQLRKDWELYRKSMEHSIATNLKETMGLVGVNVYMKNPILTLAKGYCHDDNQIRLIVKNLKLQEIPRFWMPEVQFSLASNVLKLQTGLSKVIVNADYTLMRNKTRIIYDKRQQDFANWSPFLYQQVQNNGKVALVMDDCILSGFFITTLSGNSVNLGYDHFKLIKCVINVEIYHTGDESPPVIAKYQPQRDDEWSIGLKDLVLKPIVEDLHGKLQAAMYSFVNTSSLFGDKLQGYVDEQRKIFAETATFLTYIHRNLNKITIDRKKTLIPLNNHHVFWDDGKSEFALSAKKSVGQTVIFKEMVLFGLDTMYAAHSGGPYKMDTIMIAEEMRFSTLQVKGFFELVKGMKLDRFSFAAVINDLAVDLQMDVRLDENKNRKMSILNGCSYKTLRVTGYRIHLKAILREALRPTTTTTTPAPRSMEKENQSLIPGVNLKAVAWEIGI
ncbi:hypothetical protein HF086_015347 [Spodoptera exigua]|uniref:Uncharacterized protein n=1 Tax=Spodoptera exigua TaxID=7107 RepID=A0A922S8M7_SPOEX|nr:hypothetical protein HF086_015347 [Spodoptera exigua]